MGFDYMGHVLIKQQKARQGVPAWAIFGLPVVCLSDSAAALDESWSLPFSVLLARRVAVLVPSPCCGSAGLRFSAFYPAYMRARSRAIVYSQIGLSDRLIRSGGKERDPHR